MTVYRISIEPDDNETMLVTVPAFPELTTFVTDLDDLSTVAGAAIEEAIAGRIAAGQDLPGSDRTGSGGSTYEVSLSTLTALKAGLYQLMRAQGVTRAELQRRMGCHREQVDRLLRLDHASRMDQLEAAARALGSRIAVSLEAAA